MKIDDKSVRIGGKQIIETLEGFTIPLIIKDGLVYIQSMGIPTNKDMEKLPHVMFTSPREWDPTKLDYQYPPTYIPAGKSDHVDTHQEQTLFDEHGEFIPRVVANLNILLDQPINQREIMTWNIPR